jgi:hypothetical protein
LFFLIDYIHCSSSSYFGFGTLEDSSLRLGWGITEKPSEPAAVIVGSFFLSCRFVSTFGSYGRVFAFPAGTRRDAGGQIKISGLGNAVPLVAQVVPICQQDFNLFLGRNLLLPGFTP